MTVLTRAAVQMINREAQQALEEVARRHSLQVSAKSGQFSPDGTNATLKFEFTQETATGIPMTPQFVALRAKYPEIAGYTFYIANRGYIKMIGYNSRAKKYPYIYEDCSTGKQYKTGAHILTQCTPDRREDA